MILIVDSGSPQCTWLFTDGTTTRVGTPGINAVQHTPEQIAGMFVMLPAPIEAIHFYDAGCGPQLAAASDKIRAARACLPKQPRSRSIKPGNYCCATAR